MMESSRQKRKREKSITTPDGPLKQLDIINKDQTVFSTLPNEVILHMFSYLKIVDLQKCGQVSKRFRAISNDDQYLWPKKVNISFKKVPVGFLQRLLDSGCKYLSLSGAFLEGTLNLPKASRLKYLNYSGGFDHVENSEKLLESSYSLEKLSLSNLHLSSKLISIISLQNGKTLTVVDLSQCNLCIKNYNCVSYPTVHCDYSLSIQQFVENCTELKELSLYMTKLCENSVDILLSNLTSTIEKLDLFDMTFLRDDHVKKLVTRCNKITELNLGGQLTSITKQSLNFIFEHLQLTLEKLYMRFTNAKFNAYYDLLKLKSMIKLTLFSYIMSYGDYRFLKKELPNLWIHSEPGIKTIAIPCLPNQFSQRFWEIEAEREELFSSL